MKTYCEGLTVQYYLSSIHDVSLVFQGLSSAIIVMSRRWCLKRNWRGSTGYVTYYRDRNRRGWSREKKQRGKSQSKHEDEREERDTVSIVLRMIYTIASVLPRVFAMKTALDGGVSVSKWAEQPWRALAALRSPWRNGDNQYNSGCPSGCCSALTSLGEAAPRFRHRSCKCMSALDS